MFETYYYLILFDVQFKKASCFYGQGVAAICFNPVSWHGHALDAHSGSTSSTSKCLKLIEAGINENVNLVI